MALRMGEVVEGRGLAPLWTDGPRGWFALRVAPQRERFVERWLALRGVRAFHPVKLRRAVVKGKKRVWEQCYLPGYVFTHFPGQPVAHRVTALPHVLGALTLQGGEWARIAPVDLRDLYNMRAVDLAKVSADQADAARRRALNAVRKGDLAMFRGGPLAGHVCQVLDLAGPGEARVSLRLFGADVEATARLDDLAPRRKTA